MRCEGDSVLQMHGGGLRRLPVHNKEEGVRMTSIRHAFSVIAASDGDMKWKNQGKPRCRTRAATGPHRRSLGVQHVHRRRAAQPCGSPIVRMGRLEIKASAPAPGKEGAGKTPTPPDCNMGATQRSPGFQRVHRHRAAQPRGLPSTSSGCPDIKHPVREAVS